MLKAKTKKAAVLFSGGKDSCLALHKAKLAGWEIKFLLNVFPKTKDSFMFHKPDLKLLKKYFPFLALSILSFLFPPRHKTNYGHKQKSKK